MQLGLDGRQNLLPISQQEKSIIPGKVGQISFALYITMFVSVVSVKYPIRFITLRMKSEAKRS